jgi:hypothetical protein
VRDEKADERNRTDKTNIGIAKKSKRANTENNELKRMRKHTRLRSLYSM